MEKFTAPGRRHSTKICVKEMKEKSVRFTKGKSEILENKRREGDFPVDNLGLFFQSSGNLKQDIINRNWTAVASQIAEQFSTYSLRKLGIFKAV